MKFTSPAMRQRNTGFTLVEIIVVIAVMVLLLGIILAGVQQARQVSREKKRVSDVSNIALALTVYYQKFESYPDYASGTEIGIGQPIDAIIKEYNGGTYTDPKSSGVSGDTYAYWFDSDFTCTEAHQAVVFAKTMELSKNANFADTCTSSSSDKTVAGDDTYIKVLK